MCFMSMYSCMKSMYCFLKSRLLLNFRSNCNSRFIAVTFESPNCEGECLKWSRTINRPSLFLDKLSLNCSSHNCSSVDSCDFVFPHSSISQNRSKFGSLAEKLQQAYISYRSKIQWISHRGFSEFGCHSRHRKVIFCNISCSELSTSCMN